MKPLEHSRYLELRDAAQVVEADHHGDKVLRLTDGSYLKLFRRKRLLTSAALFPYAQRFADNARQLAERGIPCPRVLEVYRAASLQRDLVHYSPLPGDTLRQLRNSPQATALRPALGGFIAELHDSGVYFRSLHLGNVVLTPDGELGLIDIADLRCHARRLPLRLRVRNFHHLLRYSEDRDWLFEPGREPFLRAYAEACRQPLDWRELDRQLQD
ncbi:lipopolysaccharide kinase InaA family protein [Pseudomonas sp. PLB05]|uniref:lipopolysaccharide kinase InaA family protein n=1 Tax=Pseudomonas sp. PLB05 TaxID=2899078 RepID=UPI001E58EA01|nr:lipopolysaccharide kinase InaA family protein [Pseudomonas sp. PLB05]MCD4866522.1 toluene tolerance protein [Pseudomonas sp. PLB05]